jgi:hypothetical protein
MNYFVLFFFGFVGFLIGRVLSLIVSLFFKQRSYLNAESARTLIVLGSGGKKFKSLKNPGIFSIN